MSAKPTLHIEKLRTSALYQEMLAGHRRATEEEERARRWTYIGCICSFFFWTAVVVAVTSWGMHTVTHAMYSRTIIEAGLLLGAVGILGTAMFAHNRLS
jgi:uncharacterized membrane protein YdcZ (DUF606 family)